MEGSNDNYSYHAPVDHGRVSRIETELTNLERDVGDLKGSMAAVSSTMNTLVSAVNRIEASQLNRPPPNYAGWAGVGLIVVSSMIALIFGMSEYVALQLDPVRSRITATEGAAADLRDFQHQTHFEFGRMFEWQEAQKAAQRRTDEVLREHDKAISASEISRRAIGDYIRQIDELGPRRIGGSERASRVE